MLQRAPNAVPLGNPEKEEFLFQFPGRGTHDQLTYLLRPRDKTNVWVGVDPSQSDAEITAAINATQVAELHMTCSWLSEKDVTMRNYVQEI